MSELKFWNAERQQIVAKLYEEKVSNSVIAATIGCGCTRNAVSGIASRMGISKPRPAARVPKTRIRKKVNLTEEEKKIRRQPKPITDIIKGDTIPPLLDSIVGLTLSNCAYPYGEKLDIKFCGRPRSRGSFCDAHADLCYQPWTHSSNQRPFRIRRRK